MASKPDKQTPEKDLSRLLLDGELEDIKAISEMGLQKLWLNTHDDGWNRYGHRIR